MSGHVDYNIGDLKWSIQESDHEYWLKCDGRSLDRVRYSALFDLIGTTYGSENSETFKLPDCRGRVVGCIGQSSGLTNRVAGAKVGTETHTLTIQEMPTHNHGITDPGHTHGITDPGHTHSQTTINDDFNQSGENPPGFTADSAGTMTWNNINSSTTGVTVNTATTGITTNNNGGGQPHNNMQPTIFIGNVFLAYKTQVKY